MEKPFFAFLLVAAILFAGVGFVSELDFGETLFLMAICSPLASGAIVLVFYMYLKAIAIPEKRNELYRKEDEYNRLMRELHG